MDSNKVRHFSWSLAVSAALLVSGCTGDSTASNFSELAFEIPPEDLAMVDETLTDETDAESKADQKSSDDVVTTNNTSGASASSTSTASGSSGNSNPSSTTASSSSSSTTSTPASSSTAAANTVPITTTEIDCISGQFTFKFSDPNNAGQISAINVLRDGVQDEGLTQTTDGVYRAQIKNSAEVVTAVVDYTAGGSSYSHTHPLADCSQIMGGQYKICNGEGIYTAYPASWFSQTDIEGPGFCGYFRSIAPDGYSDDEITRRGFSGQSLSQVVASYNSDPNVVVVNSTPQASIGVLLARPGHVLDIAHPNDPTVVISKIYLFESADNTQEIRADQIHSGTDSFAVLAAMMDTLTLFEQ